MGYTREDFESLRSKLGYMTDQEVMREYVRLLHENETCACTSKTETEYCNAAGFINRAELLLSGYLARKMCLDNGIEV